MWDGIGCRELGSRTEDRERKGERGRGGGLLSCADIVCHGGARIASLIVYGKTNLPLKGPPASHKDTHTHTHANPIFPTPAVTERKGGRTCSVRKTVPIKGDN